MEWVFSAFELFNRLIQGGDAIESIAMTRLPISDMLAEFEILALQAMGWNAKFVEYAAHVQHQSHQFGGRDARASGRGALRRGRSRGDETE